MKHETKIPMNLYGERVFKPDDHFHAMQRWEKSCENQAAIRIVGGVATVLGAVHWLDIPLELWLVPMAFGPFLAGIAFDQWRKPRKEDYRKS